MEKRFSRIKRTDMWLGNKFIKNHLELRCNKCGAFSNATSASSRNQFKKRHLKRCYNE